MLEVCLLGTGGMIPLPERRLSSMMIRRNGKMILMDCGEGTQIGIRLLGWGFKDIEALCLTHHHGDHVAGIPGFLLTLGNSGRTEPFTIFGPPPLAYVISALTVIAPQLPFDIRLVELSARKADDNNTEGDLQSSETGNLIDNNCLNIAGVNIKALPMDHMIPCLAYSFELNRTGKFDVKRAEGYKIPKELWSILQNGKKVEVEGREFSPEMVMGPPRKGLKVTYCTDSRPSDELSEFAKNSDLLILEGMYGDDELLEKAIERKHMIFSEAARVAKQSNAKELWLTHFSPSIKYPEEYIQSAAGIFPNTVIGRDLLLKQIPFENY